MVEELHTRSFGGAAPYTAVRGGGKALRAFGFARRALMRFVYPPLCPGCGTEAAEARGLCPSCWRDTTFISVPSCGRCGAPVASGPDTICDGCAHAPPAWRRGAAAIVYDGAGRKLVLSLKHADRLDVAALGARWMLRAGSDLVAAADLIAPAPMHWRRLAARRYNQAGELVREICALSGRQPSMALDLLRRDRAAAPQDRKSRAERFANVAGLISARTPARIAGKRVLLIDDVMTTGATLSACAEACRDAGAADVNALVMARVARADWPT